MENTARSTTDRLLNVDEAAQWLGLKASTLNKMRSKGGGPCYAKVGRSVRYRTIDLNAWVNSHVRSSTST
jgi:excisionase family DNA binding protein